ncbi:hypothetical protein [Piscinibacter sp. HJYY11]|uniref:hypothetical protein n=1 Tax=Piscinibacter sp. HJYY11 TaxID=2801333 RepID=UPI0019202C0D|nr:hypothetical protein [Piscinibacter sp. HJYY11]MBL0727066.1 hypothetical protein [Piscinibacter sp. HJYY11]
MIEKFLAGATLAVCVVFMLRLVAGAQRRAALDAWARLTWLRLKHGWLQLYHWRSSRKSAERLAEEAIRRARDDGHWEGNVYKPKSFSKRPPRDKMH